MRLAFRCITFILASWILTMPATASVTDPALKALCDEYWQAFLEQNPTDATFIGDHRFDDRMPDLTPEARDRTAGRLESMLDRARDVNVATLDDADRITRLALMEEISGRLTRIECRLDEWIVDPLDGPQVAFVNLVDYTPAATAEEAGRWVRRCRAMAPYLAQVESNLRRGLEANRVAPRAAVVKVISQLERLDAEPLSESALLKPLAEPPAGWEEEARTLRQELIGVIGEKVRPAFRRYLDFLRGEVLPVARPDRSAGMKFIPGGEVCYWKLIRMETSLDMSPEDIHELGKREVARIRKEMSAIGNRIFDTPDFEEIKRRARTDSTLYFSTAGEVEQKARTTLDRARRAIPRYFNILPKADCVVAVMGLHEAPQSFVGYYRQPSADGTRPGYYMINTWKPETRTRYEAEALAFHEAIPGHHLQIAINQELTDLPEFRKYRGVTAFTEGWALYSESLADEMGLYTADLDRLGMHSYDAWRACRLVVDTGLHSMGWSREQAIAYMNENTLLAPNNIENEVDRYLVMPGQALAYKLGQLEILKLREETSARLGERFDLKAFHDLVLRNGALPLPVLREQVENLERASR